MHPIHRRKIRESKANVRQPACFSIWCSICRCAADTQQQETNVTEATIPHRPMAPAAIHHLLRYFEVRSCPMSRSRLYSILTNTHSGFEVTIIVFEWTRYNKAQSLAARSSPDFSTRSILSSIFQSISGVSCSLVAFLIFGTTKMFRTIYAERLRTCVRSRRHHDSPDFQMVTSKSTETV